MEKRQTRHNRIGKILIGIMSVDIAIIFILPLGDTALSYKENLFSVIGITYRGLLLYILPFLSIIYLSIGAPTKKLMKRIIGALTIAILCIMIFSQIQSIMVTKDWMYEYSQCEKSSQLHGIETGFNLIDFIIR